MKIAPLRPNQLHILSVKLHTEKIKKYGTNRLDLFFNSSNYMWFSSTLPRCLLGRQLKKPCGFLQLFQDVFREDNSSNHMSKTLGASNLEIIGAKKKKKESTKSWTWTKT